LDDAAQHHRHRNLSVENQEKALARSAIRREASGTSLAPDKPGHVVCETWVSIAWRVQRIDVQ